MIVKREGSFEQGERVRGMRLNVLDEAWLTADRDTVMYDPSVTVATSVVASEVASVPQQQLYASVDPQAVRQDYGLAA